MFLHFGANKNNIKFKKYISLKVSWYSLGNMCPTQAPETKYVPPSDSVWPVGASKAFIYLYVLKLINVIIKYFYNIYKYLLHYGVVASIESSKTALWGQLYCKSK